MIEAFGVKLNNIQGAQWRNGNAAASQQERSRFDSRREHCGHCVMCPLLHVTGAHTLAGVGDRAFLCGVRMLSLCPQGGSHEPPNPQKPCISLCTIPPPAGRKGA